MPQQRPFRQVDVFSAVPFLGNPLAVVLDANGLDDAQMQAIARWTGLSETTFVLAPRDPAADYRVRIFSPEMEFPFAGHPTLGTAHALLDAGMQPRGAGIVQECGVGLVPIERGAGGMLAFQAPPCTARTLPSALLPLLQTALGDAAAAGGTIVDMGIRWLCVPLPDAAACLAVHADIAALTALLAASSADGLALYGAHGALVEDPVTGSANACIAHLLAGADYTVRQGTCLQRDGRVSVIFRDGHAWIGGACLTVIEGTILA
ncbi:PhzF family phenazine biosynthesis protein [Janthinobacterium lividum]|uniref:PhzF family phenazine biosynthesis protein n=1 Tax=Janthinobacterium lividum TaxID=29581 RepID=UPI003D23B088